MRNFIHIPYQKHLKELSLKKIEDEYDLVIGEEAYCEYIANRKKSRLIAELWKECDI